MTESFLSRFTPSLMTPEALEAIFVQREKLAQSLVDRLRDSVLTQNKHYMLLIGPRGMGKTHLVALVYHRIQAMPDLQDHMRVAWLREEEWGITSFLDLLLRILRALQAAYNDTDLEARMETLFGQSAEAATQEAAALLTDYVGERTLVMLAENMDDIFSGLGEDGQQAWRAYLQNHGNTTILATAQSLFNGVALRTSPFYGFFNIAHLQQFSLNDAVRLLKNVAAHEGDAELAAFLETPKGRARVRAVHHLAGGNPRLYVIFSQFLTRDALDALVEPFMQMLDELTPYYQARMQWLSPQQRKMVEFLAERGGAVPVKTIAERLFMTPQTASGQLKALREHGYVKSRQEGRESFYDLTEPMLRLVIEVKKYRSGPIRLFLDFLRLWYTQPELEHRLTTLGPEAVVERTYVQHALSQMQGESTSLVFISCKSDYDHHYEAGDYKKALQAAEEMVEVRGQPEDFTEYACALRMLGRYHDALEAIKNAREQAPDNLEAKFELANVLSHTNRYEEAEALYRDVLAERERVLGADHPDTLSSKHNLALVFQNTNRYEEAEALYREVLAEQERVLGADHPNTLTSKNNLIDVLLNQERWLDSMTLLEGLLPSLARDDYLMSWHADQIMQALYRKVAVLEELHQRITQTIALYKKYDLLEVLAFGLLSHLSKIIKADSTAVKTWLDAWTEAAEAHEELQLAIRLMNAAVRYYESEDVRVLLKLPEEERSIVRQVLGLEEAAA